METLRQKYNRINGWEKTTNIYKEHKEIVDQQCRGIFVPGLKRAPGQGLSIEDKLKVVARVNNRLEPDHAYILQVDVSNIKFGISNSPQTRLAQLQRVNSGYQIMPMFLYRFPPGAAARAELECKERLTCGTVSLLDGFTETTNKGNANTIRKIYEKHGGRLVKQ